MFEQRKQQVLDKITELTKRANELYGITLPHINVRFDVRGRVAGWAECRFGQYGIRFNRDMMLNESWDNFINDTVPHELAHIVCYIKPALGRNHDLGWKRVCRALGGTGERCHKEEVQYAHGTVYYTTSTGHVVPMSLTRHNKVQRGMAYTLQGKGKIDKSCAFNFNAPTAQFVAQPVSAPPVAATQQYTGGSNADKVRQRIAQAKRAGENQETVIQWAVATLGQKRQLAKSYVANNWPKVVV